MKEARRKVELQEVEVLVKLEVAQGFLDRVAQKEREMGLLDLKNMDVALEGKECADKLQSLSLKRKRASCLRRIHILYDVVPSTIYKHCSSPKGVYTVMQTISDTRRELLEAYCLDCFVGLNILMLRLRGRRERSSGKKPMIKKKRMRMRILSIYQVWKEKMGSSSSRGECAEIKRKGIKELEEETEDEEEEDEDDDDLPTGNPVCRPGKEKMGSSSSRGGRAEIPESVIIMTAAYLKLYQIHIPWRFSKKYIADSETRVILKIGDKTWDATLSRGNDSFGCNAEPWEVQILCALAVVHLQLSAATAASSVTSAARPAFSSSTDPSPSLLCSQLQELSVEPQIQEIWFLILGNFE
ncbi:hypothetical protein LINPERHAP2_LOCUS35599 [Linum perenne]